MSGYGLVTALRLHDKCDNSNELLTLIAVANFVDENGRGCYAARQTLAESVLISEETVKRYIPRLAAKGLIVPGNPAVAAHLPANRRPNVWNLAGARGAAGQGGNTQTPLVTSADAVLPALGGLTDPSTPSLGGQMISARGVSQTPNPVSSDPANLLPTCGPEERGDRQAGEDPSINTHTPPEQSTKPPEPAALRPVESRETSGSDGTAKKDPAPTAGLQDAAAQVLAAVQFGRELTRDERKRLTARLTVLTAGGWTVDALIKNLGDLRGAHSPVAVFSTRARDLPDVAPVLPTQKRAPGTADAFSVIEEQVAKDREKDPGNDPDAGAALIAEIRARRAQKGSPATSGVIAPGTAERRREAPVGAMARGV